MEYDRWDLMSPAPPEPPVPLPCLKTTSDVACEVVVYAPEGAKVGLPVSINYRGEAFQPGRLSDVIGVVVEEEKGYARIALVGAGGRNLQKLLNAAPFNVSITGNGIIEFGRAHG